MRRFAIISLLLFLHAVQAIAADSAHDWALSSDDGEIIRLSEEVRRQPVILFFWATWCPYCKSLMPHLQSIRLEYGEGVKILAINFRDDNDPAAFIRRTGYDFTVLPNGDDVAKLYDVWVTPGVMIVDQERNIRFDLRSLPMIDAPASANTGNHKAKAAYQAPYWAAEIRGGLDPLIENKTP